MHEDINNPDNGGHVTTTAISRATGVDIRIDRVGAGQTVVFLNGLLGQNEHWFPLLNPVSQHAECLLLQPPLLEMKGKGCSVEGVLHLTISVLETLIDGPVVIVGNSLGGHVGLRIAMERPDMVRGLVLSGSSGLFEKSYERNVEHSPSHGWIDKKITELFCDPSRMLPGMVDAAHAELSRRTAARALVRLGRSAKKDHLGDELHKVTVPVCLAWGTHDVVTPASVAEEFHQLLPNSTLCWIERCGHAAQIERPDEMGAAIIEFLHSLNASSGERQEVA